MSQRPKSSSESRKKWSDQKTSQQVLSEIAHQLRDKQPEEQPPAKSQNVTPDEEREVEEAAAVQELALEALLQELTYPKTGRERGDGPDVKPKERLDTDASDNVPES